MATENRDEVLQRIDSLYDRAESATGNYNATRAMSVAARRRGVPLAKRGGRGPDPALDAMTRQWFDAARAKLGPSVPAVLPKDRQPERPAAPARAGAGLPGGEWGALERGLPELPAGSAVQATERALPELTSGSAPDLTGLPRPALEAGTAGLQGFATQLPELPGSSSQGIPELTGSSSRGIAELPSGDIPAAPVRSVPELPGGSAPQLTSPGTAAPFNPGMPSPTGLITDAAPAQSAAGLPTPGTTDFLGFGAPGLIDLAPAETAVLPVAALPAAQAGVARQPGELPVSPAAPRRPSPRDSKTENRRKLATAQALLSRHTGQVQQPQWTAPGAAGAPSPATPLTTAAPVTDTGSYALPVTGPLTDTGSFAPVTIAAQSAHSPRAAKAIAFARAQVGKPCVWGATGPDSYDCSSLTQGAWKAAGVTLPRSAHQQALAGTPVTLADLEPGDLVLFFDDDRHVGLHIGDGMMIHAPGPGAYIREESIYGAGESAIHRVIRPA